MWNFNDSLNDTSIFWPIPGGDEIIISNVSDYRPQSFYGPAHFHIGNDIPADTEDVWAITLSFSASGY